MADALKRLVGPISLPTTSTALYTVPADTITVLRYLRIIGDEGSGGGVFTLSIGPDVVGSRLWYEETNYDVYEWAGSIPMTTGEVLYGHCTVGSSLTILVSGVESA